MKKYFYNITNRPSNEWDKKQLEAAKEFGEIIDLPIPEVPATATERTIHSFAADMVGTMLAKKLTEDCVISALVKGEPTLVYSIVTGAKMEGIQCYASSFAPYTVENSDGTKTVNYEFDHFRAYAAF